MGHNIVWDNEEQTVVLQLYSKPASKDDLYLLAQKSASMLNSVGHRVHLIIDERNINLTLSSSDMRYLEQLTPENQGAVVMIVKKGAESYKNFVQDFGKTIAPNAFAEPYFAHTLTEARRFLHEHFGVNYPSDKLELADTN